MSTPALSAGPSDALSSRNFSRLAELIHSHSGIKMPANKRTMLEGRLRKRVRMTGRSTLDDYCAYLFEEDGLDAEMVELMDVVTTNKTDFFREPAHFAFLQETLLPDAARRGQRQIKAWSAACSTGAEPYTLAMVLDDYRREQHGPDYSILATDLCTSVLAEAVAGRFAESMIEPVVHPLRRRYVLRSKDRRREEVRMAPGLRAKIAFGRLNLMDDHYPVPQDFDLIFCRNVLIYFDKATQTKVLTQLCRHLRPGGHLFIGHSESVVGIDLPVVAAANTILRRV